MNARAADRWRRLLRHCGVAACLASIVPGIAPALDFNETFLVARPGMPDPFFRDSVVLLVQPGEDGPLGIIINRPTPVTLKEVYPHRETLQQRDEPVYFGGPVSRDHLIFLYRTPTRSNDALAVLDNVYLSTNVELLESLLRGSEKPDFHAYAGYAGWAPGQLETEIARGDWYLVHAEAGWIFDRAPESIYPELLKRATSITTWVAPR